MSSTRNFPLALTGFLLILFINWSCTKLDTTTIGSDLVPEVDNINTFADTLTINTTQGIFDDTTRLSLSDNYAIGHIINDPLFGQTEAALFLQLKPPFYPYYIGIPRDTLVAFDSVVLCLGYKGSYGDTSVFSPIQLQVFEVSQMAHGEWDSLATYRNIKYAPEIGDQISEPTSIDLAALRNYRKIGKGKDSVINQIRINFLS